MPSLLQRLFSRVNPALAVILFGTGSLTRGEEETVPWQPESVVEEDFSMLKTNSPFLRAIDLSDSLILTGIARIEGDLIATLFDLEKRESHIVSRAANSLGWRMVEVDGDASDLEKVTARIAIAWGEVFTVRFDEQQLKPGELKPASATPPPGSGSPSRQSSDLREQAINYKQGFTGDGAGGPPSPETIEKMSKLSVDEREKLLRATAEFRERNPEMSRDDRTAVFFKMLDRAVQGR